LQLLFIHSDFIEYEARDKTRVAEEIELEDRGAGAQARVRVEEALVVFTAVERGDEGERNSDYVVEKATEEILSVARKVGAERVVLYPYAHLSSELASPEVSIEILKAMEEQLRARGMEVKRAPFGWYKAFTIRCKGHPLSELSRKIKAEGEKGEKEKRESKALEAEEKAESHFFFMDERGELIAPSDFKFGDADEKLKKFYLYESEKRREVDKIPPHVELMKRLEIADYEPSSDPGNMRFYPKGELIKRLIEDYVREAVAGYGAAEVETPLMYSVKHPSLKDYIERFPARQYSILGKDNKPDLFLRFSACFGQFLMSKDTSISYKSLPLKLFELAYSFRKEKRGELVGLRRLRKFTMPDMHTLCRDMSEALEEFKQQYELCMRVLADIGFSTEDYEVAIRFTRDFYDAHRDFITELVRIAGKPVLIELWDQRFFYFVLKFEFNFVDALGKASALSTVQIDVENAARYGIRYIDAHGEEREPIILHCSPSGAIERCMYALLEKAYMDNERGVPPMLPLWLSPTQLRLIPVAERHHEYIRAILPALDGIRVDVDDREETVSKKIRDAGREWIPYVGVIGDREVERGTVNVNIRATQQVEELDVKELRQRIAEGIKVKGRPYRELPLPVRLSERVRFVG